MTRCGCGQYPDVCRRYGHRLTGRWRHKADPEATVTVEQASSRAVLYVTASGMKGSVSREFWEERMEPCPPSRP